MSIQAIFVNHDSWNQGRVFIGPACFDRASAFIITQQCEWDQLEDEDFLYSCLEDVFTRHDDWTFEDCIIDPDDEARVLPQEEQFESNTARELGEEAGRLEDTISTDLREREGLKDERGPANPRPQDLNFRNR